MFWSYLGELFKRVFFPTTRGADYISVLVPLAVAGTAYFLGVQVSENTATRILAYVGVFTVLMFTFRLLISAPYGMWQEKCLQVRLLQDELSKPETAIMVHLARHRAKARAKVATEISKLSSFSYVSSWDDGMTKLFTKHVAKVRKWQAQAGLSESFDFGFRILMRHLMDEGKLDNSKLPSLLPSERITSLLDNYVMGRITGEALALELPQDTPIGKQP